MTFDELLALAREDPRIVGVFLGGSRGKDANVRADSDYDVRLVVASEDEELLRRLQTPRGEDVDVGLYTLDEFRAHAARGSETEWDRYTFTRGQVLVDKLDGGFARLVEQKGTLARGEAVSLARGAFGAYLNSLYRGLKSARLGLDLAARLHAAEEIAHLLTTLFALEQRVRPYHDALVWELETHPLGVWSAETLLELLDGALSGATEPQQRLFREVEPHARASGLGGEIESWEPDVALMRGRG